jgi:ubiquinone/menaquinone biosynthesis C-methylase UbiE
MQEQEFDKFVHEYKSLLAQSIRHSGESQEYFAEYKIKDISQVVTHTWAHDQDRLKILDFGGGIGTSVPYLRQYFPGSEVVCLDVSRKSLAFAKERFPEMASYVHFDGITIPFADNTFDIVLAACVFHHIDHGNHLQLLCEIRRVLKTGGRVFVFEHNPLNPLTLQVINTCPYDENAHLILGHKMRRNFRRSGLEQVKVRYRLFFPRLLASLRWLEKYLTWLPLGAQYYTLGTKL